MASALCRTASRLRAVQIFRRIRASSDLLSSSSPPPACISDHGDFSLPRSVRHFLSRFPNLLGFILITSMFFFFSFSHLAVESNGWRWMGDV